MDFSNKIKLMDDGTLDTVLVCSACDEQIRFSSLVENCGICEETDAEVCDHRDELIDEKITTEQEDHVCEFEYFINLDERGEFAADVRTGASGRTVYEITGFDIFEDGFMKHKKDIKGLENYLKDLKVIDADSNLNHGN